MSATLMDRRSFLTATGASLILGLVFKGTAGAVAEVVKVSGNTDLFSPNAFVKIGGDGTVSIFAARPEMGQGIRTSLPMVVAEELEVDWQAVQVIVAPLDPIYGGHYGGQAAGGSTSTPSSYLPMRQAGATAKVMLVEAAAKTWGVPASECQAASGVVRHPASGRSLAYKDLVAKAMTLPVPDVKDVPLKDPSTFKLLGTRVGQLDNPKIVTGQKLFGIDQVVPGMVYATYTKCPVFGGKVVSANLDEVKKLPGVKDAFILEGTENLQGLLPGVAIIADSTWSAISARKQLNVVWDEGKYANDSWKGYTDQAHAIAAKGPGHVLHADGNVEQALGSAAKTIEATYSYPFISHAPLEPMNATAHVSGDRIEMWVPTQNPSPGAKLVAETLGIPLENVTVHITRSGGGFGRRLSNEFMAEAAAISRKIGGPVKLQWTREDDMAHDQFRPPGFHFLKAGVDANGKVIAWQNHHVSVGYNETRPYNSLAVDEFPCRFVPNYATTQSSILCNVPMGPWRAPGSNSFAFVFQSFIDEIAHAAGRDPVELRLELLGTEDMVPGIEERGRPGRAYNAARMRGVVRKAAELADWGKPLPKGKGRGIAFHFSHQGYVAEVAEVTVSQEGDFHVDRVVAAVDVGSQIVNLSGAENQVQGSIVDGISAASLQELNLAKGRMVQTNFHEYSLLRMADAPDTVEVHFVKTHYPPTGLGEPCLPPIAPAVCNAIFAATGKRIRQLPFSRTDLSWS